MSRHTYAVFAAVFTLSLCASLSVLCVFYFTRLFVFVYLWAVLSAFVSFGDRDIPEYRLSRLAISVIFPFFSAVFFFLARRRVKAGEIELMRRRKNQAPQCRELLDLIEPQFVGAVKCLLSDDLTSGVYKDTECEYFSDTGKMLSSMLDDISAAVRSVYLEYYIISEGRVLSELLARLCECARRGVDVRIIFDDLGSMLRLSHGFAKRLSSYGIGVGVFSPLGRGIGRGNNRDHRKLLTVDGAVAYVGGMNISDEYIGKSRRFGLWRDMGVRLIGDCAYGLEESFLNVWEYCEKEGIVPSGDKKPSPTLRYRTRVERTGGDIFVPFSSAPRPFHSSQSGKRLLLNLIGAARRFVYITTPYLIPDSQLIEAMSRAIGRGVRIVIITPGVADKRLIKIITESFYPPIICSGVEIYEYPLGFLHGKSVVCDGYAALVGSLNLDYRSLAHNFENGVLVLGDEAVLPICKDIEELAELSVRIGENGKAHGIIKKTVRLFSGAILPIL